MRLWIDTEFNEYRGELISLALVADDGREWYGVRYCDIPKPWVAENVMPVLNGSPDSDRDLVLSLAAWLRQFDSVHIVADWPEDVSYFCNFIVTGPGERIDTPPLTFEVRRDLPNTSDISKVPHNALEDARALQRAAAGRAWLQRYRI